MAKRNKTIRPDADVLSHTQRRVYAFIHKYISDNNIAPSIREISENTSMSKSNVPNVLHALEKKEFIDIIPNTPRGIILLHKVNPNTTQIPLLGTIAAGVPVFAPENYEGTIEISADFVPKGELFALTVSGNSMNGANIFSGDLAIIKRDITVRNNNIVAALIDGEATLKRFYQRDDVVWLMPENPEFKPIIIADDQVPFMILGKLVATIRQY